MRALRYHGRGSLDGLVLEQVPDPSPAAGEVLVRVHWASVNPVDWKLVLGQFRFLVKGGLPRGAGSDFAGEVAACGPGAEHLAIGQQVYGCVDPFRSTLGTIADLVPVPAGSVFALPPELPLRDAAALACAGLSAVQLCDQGQVGAGSQVLVNGASGGVGHLALQIARFRGAHVTAVASAGRREFIGSLGADAFIDYRGSAARSWPGDFDAVLDCVPSLPRGMHAGLLRRGGRYVTTLPGAATYLLDPITNRVGPIHRSGLMLMPSEAAASELSAAYRAGRLRVAIEAEYGLAEARAAFERSMTGHVQGKLLLSLA
ncbi:MAG TPA: NADP-dependent oxidoreductase [Steroidobacteraceae bacterium]|nr:NADP-dependent oxidoreductase [Steroidobacteraceae bacterium]